MYFWAAVLILVGLHFVAPNLEYLSQPYTFLGILPILFGIALNLWTDQLFKKYDTNVKPHIMPRAFITRGPFAVSRHPMYLGMAAILFGCSILFGSMLTLLPPIIFILVIDWVFIPMEEENLRAVFDTQYHTYKKNVRRWI